MSDFSRRLTRPLGPARFIIAIKVKSFRGPSESHSTTGDCRQLWRMLLVKQNVGQLIYDNM